MAEDRITTLFFEMFSGLPRQGPGDATSTLRALALVPGVGPETRVLDLGCGTGLQTRVLARNTPARFLAIDNHPPYIRELNQQVETLGISDRLNGRVGDMKQLDLEPASFNLIWSEGSIWVVGFEKGLREWRSLLAPGGHLAVTDVCWTRADPPPDCAAFWAREYPAISDPAERLAIIAECGYEAVGHFPLPPSSWWDDYYRPLEQHVTAFRRRHREEPDALELADQIQREIDIWHAYSDFYSYEFFVMRRG
jgi:SAM-dependent methyltransferase